MQQCTHARSIPNYVSRFVLYFAPNGDIYIITGNQRMLIDAKEARELLEYQLTYARQFAVMNGDNMNGDNHNA